MKGLWSYLADTWCKLMHPAPMWPVNGRYQCPKCLRSYRVPWEENRCAVPVRVETAAPRPVLVASRSTARQQAATPRPVLVESRSSVRRRAAIAAAMSR